MAEFILILALVPDPERFLATVQIGITLVSATAAAYGGASIASRIAPWLEQIPWVNERAEPLALVHWVRIHEAASPAPFPA